MPVNSQDERCRWTIQSPTEIPFVRKQCGILARQFGLDHKAESALAIAVSELLTNALKFGSRATIHLEFVEEPRCGVQITCCDNGPGFDNIEKSKLDGYSEGRFLTADEWIANRRGMGNGLGAVIRLTDKLEIFNLPNGGACARIWKWIQNR